MKQHWLDELDDIMIGMYPYAFGDHGIDDDAYASAVLGEADCILNEDPPDSAEEPE